MMNNLEEVIKQKYGSLDKMLENTEEISRSYLFKIVNGETNNPSKNILKELSRLLELSVEEVIKLIDNEEI